MLTRVSKEYLSKSKREDYNKNRESIYIRYLLGILVDSGRELRAAHLLIKCVQLNGTYR